MTGEEVAVILEDHEDRLHVLEQAIGIEPTPDEMNPREQAHQALVERIRAGRQS